MNLIFGIYEGEFQNDMKNGLGIYRYANGESYKGQFVNDKMQGQGTFVFVNGDKYVGPWVNYKKEGEKENYFILLAIDMKALGRMIRKRVKVLPIMRQAIDMKESGKKVIN